MGEAPSVAEDRSLTVPAAGWEALSQIDTASAVPSLTGTVRHVTLPAQARGWWTVDGHVPIQLLPIPDVPDRPPSMEHTPSPPFGNCNEVDSHRTF